MTRNTGVGQCVSDIDPEAVGSIDPDLEGKYQKERERNIQIVCSLKMAGGFFSEIFFLPRTAFC